MCCVGLHWHQDLYPGKKFGERSPESNQVVSTRPDSRCLSCTTLILLSRIKRSRGRRIAQAKEPAGAGQTQEAGLRPSRPRLPSSPVPSHGRDKDRADILRSNSAFPHMSSMQAGSLDEGLVRCPWAWFAEPWPKLSTKKDLRNRIERKVWGRKRGPRAYQSS